MPGTGRTTPPRGPRRAPGALALAACVVLAGCGSDSGSSEGGKIPPGEADAMLAALDELQSARESQDCDSAEQALTSLHEQVSALGEDVDPEIRQSLQEGLDQADTLVERDVCEPSGTTDTETTETSVPDTTVPVEPETTTEETTTTTEETTTTTEEEPPPEEPKPPEQPPNEGPVGGGNPPPSSPDAPSSGNGGVGTGGTEG